MWAILASVFFFQAEDGIRDVAVTGVQTCALPIYSLLRAKPSKDGDAELRGLRRRAVAMSARPPATRDVRSEEHTSELQSRLHLVCRLLLEKKKKRPCA